MRLLVLLTRDPGGRATGRKTVIRTIIRSLRSLGHDVDLGVFESPPASGDGTFDGLTPAYLGTPSAARVALSVITGFLPGRMSLNECAYWMPRGLARLRDLVARRCPDAVVCDMLRLAPYADALGRPWILDLDDLLSDRYAERAAATGPSESFLGYYEDRLPSPLRPLARALVVPLLRRESRVAAAREVHFARRAGAVSLVSALEAGKLEQRAGVPVHALPMSVPVPPGPVWGPATVRESQSGVFVGGMDYQPNLDAVRHYLEQVLPGIRAAGLGGFRLDVIGYCPDAVRARLERPGLRFVGYVDDLYGQLATYPVFLAPLVSGTGIKTKVLECMAAGVPGLFTPAAVYGLDVQDGVHCRLAPDGPAFGPLLAAMLADVPSLAEMSRAAHVYVRDNFSPEAVAARWRQVLETPGLKGGAR